MRLLQRNMRYNVTSWHGSRSESRSAMFAGMNGSPVVVPSNARSAEAESGTEQVYQYRWSLYIGMPTCGGDRKGQLCRVLARGKMNNAMIEFLSDGQRFLVSRNSLKKSDYRLSNSSPSPTLIKCEQGEKGGSE